MRLTIGRKIMLGYALAIVITVIIDITSVGNALGINWLSMQPLELAAFPLLGALVIGAAFWFYVRKNFVAPVKSLTGPMLAAAGDPETGPDLTRRCPIENNDEIGEAAEAYNKMLETVRMMIAEVQSAAEHLTATTEQFSMLIDQTRSAVRIQENQTTQAATAMNEMAATVQEVAHSTSVAAQASSDGRESAVQAQDMVAHTIQSIHGLSREIDSSVDVIRELESDSEQIGMVIAVINDIAQKTNLLALNAAIEAARAGERGRGFAVVAEEVRTLAKRTQNSTQDIGDRIHRVQDGARNAVAAMNQSRTAVDDTVNHAEKVGAALQSIVNLSERITDMVTQIAGATEQQSATAEEINRNVDTIHVGTREIAKGSETSVCSIQELADHARRLQMVVAQFTV